MSGRWRDDAACANTPRWDRQPTARQLADCAGCPVRFACLDQALAVEEAECRAAAKAAGGHPAAHLGHLIASGLPIFGGMTIEQRARILLASRFGARPADTRTMPRAYAACGTPAGAVNHTRHGERRCDACANAARRDRRQRRQEART